MNTKKIVTAILKCGGCLTIVKNNIGRVVGVQGVVVNHDDDSVTVNF